MASQKAILIKFSIQFSKTHVMFFNLYEVLSTLKYSMPYE